MSVEYAYRPSIRKVEHFFRVTDSGLEFETSQGEQKIIAWRDVRAVNLTMIGNGRYRLVVKDGSGNKVMVVSHHYVSLGSFEDRTPQFREFVDAFFARIEGHRASIRVTLGVPWLFYTMVATLAVVPLLVIGVLVAMLVKEEAPPLRVLTKLGLVVVVMVVIGIPILRKGRPKALSEDSEAWRAYLGG